MSYIGAKPAEQILSSSDIQDGAISTVDLANGCVTAAKIASGQILPASGIVFPATQSASADANTLDDYEEGTWTPVVKLGSTVNTSSGVNATYTKIGRVVYIQATIATITKSGTGNLFVDGLPFTVGSSSLGDIQATVRWEAITSGGVIYGYFSGGGTTISMQNYNSSGYTGAINNTNCSTTYSLYGIQGFYFVS